MHRLPFAIVTLLTAGTAAVAAADDKRARACPQGLASYASADGAVRLEFSGAPDLSFWLLVEGQPSEFTGYVFAAEGVDGMEAVVLDNCPEGDVTGSELAACTVWRGALLSVAADGGRETLPAADRPAAGQLDPAGLSGALSASGRSTGDFETLALAACQE